jgi:biotin transporter BioY
VHIAAVGWIYVTLMMAITEETVVAGIMTFFLYGVLPTLIIVYLGGSPQRRRRNEEARMRMMLERQNNAAQESKPDADGVK